MEAREDPSIGSHISLRSILLLLERASDSEPPPPRNFRILPGTPSERTNPWLLGAPLVVFALCAAPPAARRSGGRHSRGAKRFSGTLTRTTAAAFNSPSGALGPRARSANSCALRRVTTPGPVVGGTTSRPARMRGRWTDSSSSRARALLTAARALQQECRKPQCGIVRLPHRAAAAPLLLGHHRELGGPLRGRGQHRAGSLLRAGADRGCGLKALPADLWPGACQTAGPNTPALARATAPGAGWDISS